MVWQLYQPCHGCFWCGISNVRNSRSLNLMTAQKNKQHIKKILLSKTQLEYLSKLAYIVLSHQYTDLGCARQNMSQRCPELTKFLPNYKTTKLHFFDFQARDRGTSARAHNYLFWTRQVPGGQVPDLIITCFETDKCQSDKCQTAKLLISVTGQVPGGQVPGHKITCFGHWTSARVTSASPQNCLIQRLDKCQAT